MSVIEDALERRIGELLAAGDSRAAVTLAVRGYGPQILGYLQAVLRSADDGAEAFSRFCESLWVGIDGFQRRNTFKAWAYTIAWHAALRVAQEPARRHHRRLSEERAEKLVAAVRSLTPPHLLTANKDRLAELRRALDPAEQTLLILRLNRSMSWREIAEVLVTNGEETSEAGLRKRFERIKERLRALAVERGLLPER